MQAAAEPSLTKISTPRLESAWGFQRRRNSLAGYAVESAVKLMPHTACSLVSCALTVRLGTASPVLAAPGWMPSRRLAHAVT